MRVCLPKPRLASPAAAAKDLPSDPMQTVHPVGHISLQDLDSFPHNEASQLQVMPGFALETQRSETVFKNKVTGPAMANTLDYPAASQSRCPAKHLLAFPPSLCAGPCTSTALVLCRCNRNLTIHHLQEHLIRSKEDIKGPIASASSC